jgi:hypothetical protein
MWLSEDAALGFVHAVGTDEVEPDSRRHAPATGPDAVGRDHSFGTRMSSAPLSIRMRALREAAVVTDHSTDLEWALHKSDRPSRERCTT